MVPAKLSNHTLEPASGSISRTCGHPSKIPSGQKRLDGPLELRGLAYLSLMRDSNLCTKLWLLDFEILVLLLLAHRM